MMDILKIIIVVIVSLAVILPGYFRKKSRSSAKGQKLISAVAGVLLLVLVWFFPPDHPGSLVARIGLTVMAIVPIVFWLIDTIVNPGAKDKE